MIKDVASRNEVKWLACLDIDEFLLPSKPERTILDVLEEHPECGALAVNWQCYGTSGIWRLDPTRGDMLLERLLWKNEEQHLYNHHYKLIVRPERTVEILPHHLRCIPPYLPIQTSGAPVPLYKTRLVDVSELRLNHYELGDGCYYLNQKLRFYRTYSHCPLAQDNMLEMAANWGRARSDAYDPIMLRWVDRLRQILSPAAAKPLIVAA